MRLIPKRIHHAAATCIAACFPLLAHADTAAVNLSGWGFVTGQAGGFSMTEPADGSFSLSAVTPQTNSGASQIVIRNQFDEVALTPGDSLTLSGSFELKASTSDGPVYLGWSHFHFGLFNSEGNAGTLVNNEWVDSVEAGYNGYMVIVPTAGSGASSPWGSGPLGSAGANSSAKTNDWFAQGSSIGLGGPFQSPDNAGVGQGKYDLSLKVTRLSPYVTQIDYLVESEDDGLYLLQGTVYDTGVNANGTNAATIFDTVGFRCTDSRFTDVEFTDLKIEVETGESQDPNNLYDFETGASGWQAYDDGNGAAATVAHQTLDAGTVNDEGAMGVTTDQSGLVWGASVELTSSDAAFTAIHDGWTSSAGLIRYAVVFDVTLLSANSGGYTGDVSVYGAIESGDNFNTFGTGEGEIAPATGTWDADKVLTAALPLSEATLDEAADSLTVIVGIETDATASYTVLIDNVRMVSLAPTPELRRQVAGQYFGLEADEQGFISSPDGGWMWVTHFPYVYSYELTEWRGKTAEYDFGWLWAYGNFETGTWVWDFYFKKWFYTVSSIWPWVYVDGTGWTVLSDGLEAARQEFVLAPNALTLANGDPVEDSEDWEARRAEIKELFAVNMYGHMPPPPDSMTITPGEWSESGSTKTQNVVVEMTVGENTVSTTMVIQVPIDPEQPAPIMLTSEPFGSYYRSAYINAGWAGAGVNFGTFAPDSADARSTGLLYELYGSDLDTGSLMGWAWSYSRLIDVLEELNYPEIDLDKIAVTGHSRYGKAALITGAFDERVALTAPSHSGSAGAGTYKHQWPGSEPVSATAPHWMVPNFQQMWSGEDQKNLPVDAHLLTSLVAPRALIQIEGTLDTGTNPQGTQLSFQAAQEVYAALDASENLGIRFRPVGHVGNDGDVIEFANYLWNGGELSEGFNLLPYSIAPAAPEAEESVP